MEPATEDWVLGNLASLATAASEPPLVGSALDGILEVPDAALAIQGGTIAWAGPQADLPSRFAAWPRVDSGRATAVPGFVDPHTHLVFAGDRADEFDSRARGAAYLEILARGGGILDTVRRTRQASDEELLLQARSRLERILAHGTTTVEVKSGYGLDLATELRMLRVARRLGAEGPVRIVPTFMGPHAVPPEYRGRTDAYLDLVIAEMLPAVKEERLADSVDIFCEQGVFDLDQTRRFLGAAAALGFGIRMHADEVHPMGGGRLAAELGARSADHLIATDEASIAALAGRGTVATLLPGTAFNLGKGKYAPARRMIEAGCTVALATDLNPGSCHLESMVLAMQIAIAQMRLTPAEALNASTANSAFALGLHDRVGRLAPGMQADLTLVDAPSYRHLGYRLGTNLVVSVVIGGRLHAPPGQTRGPRR